jgi:L-asparaginase
MNIRILVTGGTLDKIHDTISESLTFADHSHVPEMVSVCRMDNIVVEQLMLIDSLDMTEAYQQEVADAVTRAPEKRIVITHGTSRMASTAEFLSTLTCHFSDKVIVITGAMKPYSFSPAEPSFNLGGAVIAARTAPAGVYIVMNGQLFSSDNVEKNTQTGVFGGKE